jgi:hypothetical protein
VILEHTGTASYKPGVHWDLLCEAGESLRAWGFRESPFGVLQQHVCALPDHRLAYLAYEGPISGDRGLVRRVAEGTFNLLRESPTEWFVRLHGDTIAGDLQITRSAGDATSWTARLALQPLQPE